MSQFLHCCTQPPASHTMLCCAWLTVCYPPLFPWLQAFAMGGVPGAVPTVATIPGMAAAVPGLAAAAIPGALPGAPAVIPSAAVPTAVPAAGGATTVVLLENVMNVGSIRNDQERRELQTDVYTEASKFGALTGITIPVPPAHVPDGDACRVYLKFTTPADALRCQQTMEGRMFDDNKVRAVFVSEPDFFRAQAGEWLPAAR